MRSAKRAVGAVVSTLVAAALVVTPAQAAPVPEHVVVWGAGSGPAYAAVEAAGGQVDAALPLVGGVAARLTPSGQRAVEARGLHVADDVELEVADADSVGAGAEEPARPEHLDGINVGGDWSLEAGAGVGVALVDTGVAEVPDLAGRVIHGPDFSGENAPERDSYGHGTFMAGLIAGDGIASADGEVRYAGVAPSAHVVSVKVAGRDGTTTLSRLLEGIGWVVTHADEHAIRVLNLSVAVPPLGATHVADPLSGAVEAAWAAGITVVAASGNEGDNGVTSPGRDPWVITVGALDLRGTPAHDDDVVPAWSGRSDTRLVRKPEILAPGVSVVSTVAPGSTVAVENPGSLVDGNYIRGTGTSMAAALVSGAVAVLTEHHAAATPDDYKAALVAAGDEVPGAIGVALDLGGADLAQPAPDWWQRHPVAFNGLGLGLTDAMPWAGVRWAESPWAGVRWAGTRWAGVRWAEETWTGVRWAGVRWAGVRWADSEWAGVRWAGVRWADEVWSGVRWAGVRWAGVRWAESDWAGVRWAGVRWAGVRWAGVRWAGVRWATSRWT